MLIMGGALGNLSDRLIHGFVIDFLDFYVGDCIGLLLILLMCLFVLGAALIIIESFSLIRMPIQKAQQAEVIWTDQLTKITPA